MLRTGSGWWFGYFDMALSGIELRATAAQSLDFTPIGAASRIGRLPRADVIDGPIISRVMGNASVIQGGLTVALAVVYSGSWPAAAPVTETIPDSPEMPLE